MCSMTNHSVFGSQKTYTFSVVDGSAITITGYTSAYMFIKSTGSITLAKTTNVKVIVVGGGGGGGRGTAYFSGGGGGGAGSVGIGTLKFFAGQIYNITVGSGGIGGTGTITATNGGSSSIVGNGVNEVASGGGNGQDQRGGGTSPGTGGSGGGGVGGWNQTASGGSSNAAGALTYYYNNGAQGSAGGGGGGGASGGGGGGVYAGGAGGNGITWTMNNIIYGGGGGGGGCGSSNGVNSGGAGGSGGSGGGGAGAKGSLIASVPPGNPTAGTVNTGGGGGGGGAGYGVGGIGGAGGSGVVIIVYDPAPGLVYTTYSNKTIGNDQPNFFNYLSFIGGYTADATRGVTLSTFSYILKIATLTVLWTGFFVPNITGIWYFSGSADDQAALFISPNPITNTASGYIFAANDACSGFTGNAEGTISLTANVRYYMSVLYSNTGGDIAFNMFNAPPPTSGGTGSSANRTTDFTGLIFQS